MQCEVIKQFWHGGHENDGPRRQVRIGEIVDLDEKNEHVAKVLLNTKDMDKGGYAGNCDGDGKFVRAYAKPVGGGKQKSEG